MDGVGGHTSYSPFITTAPSLFKKTQFLQTHLLNHTKEPRTTVGDPLTSDL